MRTDNPSRLEAASWGAQEQPNLWLHYSQAIDYFLPICTCCLVAIVLGGLLGSSGTAQSLSHYSHTSPCSQPRRTAHSIINSSPDQCNHSPSFHVSRFDKSDFSDGKRWQTLWWFYHLMMIFSATGSTDVHKSYSFIRYQRLFKCWRSNVPWYFFILIY